MSLKSVLNNSIILCLLILIQLSHCLALKCNATQYVKLQDDSGPLSCGDCERDFGVGSTSISDDSQCNECKLGYFCDREGGNDLFNPMRSCLEPVDPERIPSGQFEYSQFLNTRYTYDTMPTDYSLHSKCTRCLSPAYTTYGIGVFTDCPVSAFTDPCAPGQIEKNGECEFCEHGTCRNVETMTCQSCMVGTHGYQGGSNIFDNVRVGLDCDRSTGVVQCTICDRGKYTEETNAMFCTDCELGKYQNDSSCYRYIHENDINDAFLNCPSSPWQTCDTAPCHAKKDRCETCPLGSIGHESGKYCNKCDPGTSSNSNEKEWILDQNEQPMLKGKYLDFSPLPTECIDCIAGTFSADGMECHQCAVNQYSNTRADTCTACEMGKTNNGDHTSCIDCAESFLTVTELHNHQIFETNDLQIQSEYGTCVGCGSVRGKNFRLQRSEGRNGTCERCEQGSYTNKSNALECDLCPPCPEQYYRTGCGEGDNSIGECVKCQDCDNEDEIRIDCKNREGHNNAFGRCVKKTLLTRTPECPRMNAFTKTFQTIGLGGYGYTDVFGVNENQTQFQCRQPCDSTTAVVNVEHVKQKEKLWDLGYGVVDSGYCTEAYACNTVSCLTQAENRETMACPQKIEDDDDATSILRKRGDSCVSCESCIGRGCVDCAQLLCDDGEVWDWTEDDLTFKCKKCSSLRDTNLCRNSNLIDFKPEHWPSGLIPIVKFDGCVGKNEQSLKSMTYGRCEKIDDVLTQTCDQLEQFYSRSEGKCVSCLPRNTRMQEIVYQNSTGDQHRTYCQITGCKSADVTGVSKWGMLCTEECSEKTCQDTEQLVSCVVPHDTRCVSTHMPGNHRVGVSNFKRDFVPVHANLLEPIRVDEDTDFYFSSSFENHLITLDEYAENEFQCVWNARNIQDLNEIPGGNSRTFLAKSDVTSFERYDPEGTKKCRKWPAKAPYPLLPLQNAVRDIHSEHGLFLLNSSASVMSYNFEDEDGMFSALDKAKKKFSAHRLTGDLFLNIDMNSESQVNFMSFVRPANDSWVDKWEVSLLARDSSEPFHGNFLLEMALPTSKGDAMRAIQPQLLQTVNPAMPDNFISKLFCKNSNAELCFLHDDTPDFSDTETSLKFFRLLRDRQYVILQKYLAPSVHDFGTCDTGMKLFKYSSPEHLESGTSMIVKRNIAPTLTQNVLVGLVSDVHDFAACTANDVMVRCFRACKDGEAYEWAKDDAVIFDLSSHLQYLLVSTFDLNRIEYGYVLIDVGTGTKIFLGLLPNFKVFLSSPDSVWLLLRDFDTTEMSLQQFNLIASENDVQVLSTENVINLEWSVTDTTFLSARSTLISRRDATWLVVAPYSVDQEFEARLSIRVHRQDRPLLKQDYSLEQGNSWNFVNIQQSQSYLSHAWIHDSKVAVGYNEQLFILKFDFDKETISFQIASESNLQRHHFVGFRGGVITSEFVSPALSSQSVQNCYMGYVHTDSDKYKQIGVNIELTEHHCYHKCNALESCDGIRVIQSSNATFCALYEFQSQMNHTGDIPSCVRDATYLQRYTLEFHQTQQEFETYVNVYSSKAAKSSGVFITSILHEAADLSLRGSGIDGFFAYDLKEFTDGDVADDVQVDHGKDFTTTKTLLTQYFPSVNTVDVQFKALPHFPYVHSKIDSDEVGLLSYTTPSHETQEFNADLFLEIRVNTVEQDPWLAIIRLNCTADARVYMHKSVFESMAACTSEYAYLIVYYKESTLMFDYHNVQAFDARKRITHTDDYARVLLNFRTSLVFLQRMPHVPAAVFKNPETFLSKQAKATSLQRDWQIFRRTTSVKPENVSVSLINSQRREGSVAIDNMQVVPLLNVGIKSFEQIGDTRIQETEFYIPSHSELSELALESVVTGNDLENWERMHVNFRVQTDTPGCEVEMRVLHVARDAEYHIGCRETADAHNETMCSVEVPTYFAENQDKQLPYVRTRASCEMQAVTVFFNPLSPMSTCLNLNQYYDYHRDLCVGCEYRVKNCPLGMFMPGCDAFGHTAECQNCSGGLGSNEEFVQGDLVCQRRCVANYYRFEGECVPCGETLKNSCNATHRWQACTETEDEKCVECDPIIKSVFGGNEEYVQSEQGECVTQCKEGHWRDLSEPPFFCRPCRTTEEVLNGRDISGFRIQNCTAFSDTLAVSCTEENDQTCGLPSSDLHLDECGICGGNNSTCMDCKGVIGGSSEEDRCGVCDGTNLCVDCNDVPHGGAVEDACGECGGDNTTCMDKCGVINGNNSCLVDYEDECGVLNGDNSTCLGCDGSFQILVKDIQCHKCDSTPRNYVIGSDDIVVSNSAENIGEAMWNISTNQGFTIIMKMKWTSAESWESLLDFRSLYAPGHRIKLIRSDSLNCLYVQWVSSQGYSCRIQNADYSICDYGAYTPANTWFSHVIRYDNHTKQICQIVDNGTPVCKTCSSTFTLQDTVLKYHDLVDGQYAGIYGFDRVLTTEEQTQVLQQINVDAADYPTRSGCECDHDLCGEPESLFTNCPKYTECATASCTRLQECRACAVIEIYDTTTNECALCPAGTFANDIFCEVCAAGKISQEGALECTECPTHSQENSDKTKCFCSDGYHLQDSKCELCSAGQHSKWDGIDDTSCQRCAADHYCEGDGYERPCPGNMQSDPGSISVNNCNCLAGHGWYDDVESCQQCKRGWYSESVSRTPCDQCPKETPYSDVVGSTTSTQCRACHVGAYHKDFNVGDNVEIDFDVACGHCEVGKILIESYNNELLDDSQVNNVCQECAPGTMNRIIDDHDYPGLTIYNQTCLPCPAGTHKHDDDLESYDHDEDEHIPHGDSNCYLCDQHHYTESAGEIKCTKCPPNSGNDHTIEHMDSKDHCKCDAGYERGEVDYCEQCTAGKKKIGHDWIDMTEEGCTFCDNGKTNTDDFTECRNCVSGEYSKDDGICKLCGDRQTSGAGESSCKCNAGYTGADGDSSASSSCSQCPAGYYKTQPGSAECEMCDFGKFSSTPAASVCQNCIAGKYLDVEGGTLCKNCPSNSHSSIAAQSCACNAGFFGNWESCQSCAKGKYKTDAGPGGCTDCPGGKYSSTDAATSATDCISCHEVGDNFGTSGTGATECGCNAGYFFTDDGSSIECLECRYATYKDTIDRATDCISCDASTNTSARGKTSDTHCDKCAWGYGGYDDTILPGVCSECASGKYNHPGSNGACIDCEDGKYANYNALTSCNNCPENAIHEDNRIGCMCNAGFEAAYDASHELQMQCVQCAAGKYKNEASKDYCFTCPADSTSLAGSTSISDCTCNTGYEPNYISGEASISCGGMYFDYYHPTFWPTDTFLSPQCASATSSTHGVFVSNRVGESYYRSNLYQYYTIESDGPIQLTFSQFELHSIVEVSALSIRCNEFTNFNDGSGRWTNYVKQCKGTDNCDTMCSDFDIGSGKYYMSLQFYTTNLQPHGNKAGFVAEFYGGVLDSCTSCPAGKSKPAGNNPCV